MTPLTFNSSQALAVSGGLMWASRFQRDQYLREYAAVIHLVATAFFLYQQYGSTLSGQLLTGGLGFGAYVLCIRTTACLIQSKLQQIPFANLSKEAHGVLDAIALMTLLAAVRYFSHVPIHPVGTLGLTLCATYLIPQSAQLLNFLPFKSAHQVALPDSMTDLTLEVQQEKKRLGALYFFFPRSETEEVLATLLKPRMCNTILVGKSGSGKTELVKHLALAITAGKISCLQKSKVMKLSLTQLNANTVFHGQFEGKVQHVLNYLHANPDVILFIDEFHMISQFGATFCDPARTLSNILKDSLPHLRIIGATTPEEFNRHLSSQKAFLRRFTITTVDQLPSHAVEAIVTAQLKAYANMQDITLGADSDSASKVLNAIKEVFGTHLPMTHKFADWIDRTIGQLRVKRSDDSPDTFERFLDTFKQVLQKDRD